MRHLRTGHVESTLVQGFRLFPGLLGGLAVLIVSLLFSVIATAAHAETQAETQAADPGPSAVIVMYHRFGEGDYPSTNIALEQFDAHIEELKTGDYTVLALADVVAAIKNKSPLPPKAVVITIDDAYRSVYTEAWPRLKEAGFPFTVFVATEAVDRATSGAYKRYMTWDQVREMKDAGVTIGHHTVTHLHMPKADRDRNTRELGEATKRYIEELGAKPTLFAYPYGEASTEVIALIAEDGFAAAFGQHSGAAGYYDDIYYLPRFALNENYGDLDRFRLVTSTHTMPTGDIEPKNMTISPDNNPPAIGFTIAAPIGSLAALNCFVSGEGKVEIETLGDMRVEVRPAQPFGQGRTRLNCTMPRKDGGWYWFGRQFYLP